jgi:hypothetical protein
VQKRVVSVVSLCFLLLSILVFTTVVQANDLDTVAYINIAADGWSVQLWPDNHFDPENNPTDVIATTQVVDGYGQYTVMADFSQTEAGFISSIDFMDVEISNGELVYHNSFMQIDSFKVNGVEVVLGNTYTSSDDGITTRTNLYNEWVGDEITDGRTADGRGGVTARPFDVSQYDQIVTLEITFTLMPGKEIGTWVPDEALAYISFASSDWAVQMWKDNYVDPATNPTAVVFRSEQVEGYGQYTVSVDFTGTEGGYANGIAFFDVEISNGELMYPNSFMRIDSLKINGEPVELGPTYTSSDNALDTRTNLYNEWVGEITEGRTIDGSGDVTATPVDNQLYSEVKTIEVVFTLMEGTEIGLPAEGLTAHLSMFDATWINQFILGDDAYNVEGAAAITAAVKGYGRYTVGLDLSGAAEDFTGIGQLSLVINDGETYMPYNFIRLDSIRINGEDVAFTGYSYTTGVGPDTRTNIFDDMSRPSEGDRTNDRPLTRVTGELINAAEYADTVIKLLEVTFTVLRGEEPAPYEVPESFNAFMMFSDTDEERWQVYNPGYSGDTAVIGDGTFRVYLKAEDLNAADDAKVFANGKAMGAQVFLVDIQELGKAMVALGTLREDASGALRETDLKVTVKVFVDGEEVPVRQDRIVVGDIEGNGRLRIELYNAWGPTGDLPAIDPALITPENMLEIEFTLEGTGIER